MDGQFEDLCRYLSNYGTRKLKSQRYVTYQYVLQLRKRLESTLKIAQDSLGKLSRKYKRYYDRKAVNSKLKVSDKALMLLPTKTNKLLMEWKGQYEVVEKLSPLNYRIKVGRKVKTFHINMLKQYIEREDDEQSDQLNDTSQVCAISVIDMASEESNDEVKEGLIETEIRRTIHR